MKVVCVSHCFYNKLVIGKIYLVSCTSESSRYGTIYMIDGSWYQDILFKTIDEIREEKLNIIFG